MDSNIIRLQHFYDKEAYCRLQEYFGSHDYKRNYDERISEPYDDMTIIYHELDELAQKEHWVEKSFIQDFLIPGIENLGNNYIDNFNKTINDKGLFTKELVDGFAKHYNNKLEEIKIKVSQSKFLTYDIKLIVIAQIFEIERYSNQYFENPYPNIKNKIQVNWSRARLIYFFHLMRENKQISWISDADLGRIIDSVYEYQNYKNTKEYLPCKDTNDLITKFKNNTDKSVEKVNKELREIFINENFYNV